jgi:hypothetical protein
MKAKRKTIDSLKTWTKIIDLLNSIYHPDFI